MKTYRYVGPRRLADLASSDIERFEPTSEAELARWLGASPAHADGATTWTYVVTERAGLEPPPRWSHAFTFRRCRACGAINVVKEDEFVCAPCGAPLSAHWNFDEEDAS